MSELRSPQPLGAFGIPAGFMLVPGGDEITEARLELAAGRVPREWPAALEVHRLVHADDLAGALALLAEAPSDPIPRYHLWLIGIDAAATEGEAGRERLLEESARVRAALPESVAPLVDVVLHTLGLGGSPAERAPGPSVLPEVRALVLASSATEALRTGDTSRALAALFAASEAARSNAPVLQALLLATSGALKADLGDAEGAEADLAAADQGLADSDLNDVRAEVLLRRGSLAQQGAASASNARASLQEAMRHYYAGLQLVTEQSSPQVWASLNLNLATAQLAVPMSSASDQLRLGVAAQSLRASRRVFTCETHPQQWAVATLDLANALVYTPSTHQADNLVEAVELYEQVLTSGARGDDPLARARLLTNQANALAHLGVFDEARPKLHEAKSLFEQHLQHESALAVGSILEQIRQAEAENAAAPGSGSDELTDVTDLAELARRAEQMSRMPSPASFSSGMGVRVTRGVGHRGGRDGHEAGQGDRRVAGLGGIDTTPPPPTRVTVVDPSTRPTKE